MNSGTCLAICKLELFQAMIMHKIEFVLLDLESNANLIVFSLLTLFLTKIILNLDDKS